MSRELDLQVAQARGDEFWTPAEYSTNIAIAWKLVEEMTSFDFELDYETGHNEPWVCVAWVNTQFSSFVEGVAKTPQEAICKCYLEWKGAQK